MSLKDLENMLSGMVIDLKPVLETPADDICFETIEFDYSEKDNKKWIELITRYLNTAKTFEIHCWNEETEWIDLTTKYGTIKEDDWKYGKIITGPVTEPFVQMLLNLPKPTDTEIENKMTPFFNIFLDDNFQSCHYGTEVFVSDNTKFLGISGGDR